MELGSLLGYGASERSLALMWRLGLLDMLLPQHALYLKVGGWAVRGAGSGRVGSGCVGGGGHLAGRLCGR